MSDRVPAVIYAAKSTEDKHGSIPTQLADCRELAERERFEVRDADQFSDEAFSAYSGNRGPGLERAKARAADLAAEQGRCILIAQDADRFARGAGDAPGAADHLGEVYFAMKRQGVELWTVRSGHLDLLRAAIEGERSHDESARKTQSVKAGLKRRKERGQHNGGPPPDGWKDVRGEDDEMRRVHDSERVPAIQHLFELADRGLPDGPLARQLNAEGYRTRGGQPWTRRAVQNHVTNVWHSGRVALRRGKPDEEIFDGDHEPLVDPTTFDRIQKRRAKRDLGAGQHVKGRPAHRHLIARMPVCGVCGSPMYATTSSYRRKDGTRARWYACRGYRNSDGTCDFKVDAEVVDTAVLENLPRLMPDFDQWIKQIEDRHAAERDRLERARDKATADRDAERRKLDRVEDNYLALDAEQQEQLRGALARARAEFDRTEVRATATEDALASVPVDVPHDRLLDFASKLRAVVSGKLNGDRSVGELNCALHELFTSFTICRELREGTQRVEVEDALKPDGLYIFPNLRWEVAMRLVAEYDGNDEIPAPPMEWIEALTKSANTHEYRRRKPNRGAFAASQP
jgi:DNA invertase Pin-like site-specific DNA recombinase